MQFANIEWRTSENGTSTPYSLDFNDVYFNSENGSQETEHVFIEHNQLKARFTSLNQATFTITETGFGTGLNFLVVADYWLKHAPKTATLRFISIEKTPLTLTDLALAHTLWPQFATISHELLQHYANLNTGNNQFSMAERRIDIGLHVDDILTVLPQISQIADAWILDGFAPAKNAEMWSDQVFAHMARLSKPNTTFATFSSAGAVKRGLQAVGFTVNKHAGFGKKREMLSGVFTGSTA